MAEAAPVIKTHCWVPSGAMTRSSQSTVFPYNVFSKNVFFFRLNIFSSISLPPSLPKSSVDLWTSLRWPKSLFGENFIVDQYTNGSLLGFVKSKCIGIVLAPPSSPLPLQEKKTNKFESFFLTLLPISKMSASLVAPSCVHFECQLWGNVRIACGFNNPDIPSWKLFVELF